MSFFKSKYEELLKQTIVDLKVMHDAIIEKMEARHSAEMERVLTENKRLQSEIDRVRLAAGQVGSAAPIFEPDAPDDPSVAPTFTGTPWQRIQAREMWLQTPAGKQYMLLSKSGIVENPKAEEPQEESKGAN